MDMLDRLAAKVAADIEEADMAKGLPQIGVYEEFPEREPGEKQPQDHKAEAEKEAQKEENMEEQKEERIEEEKEEQPAEQQEVQEVEGKFVQTSDENNQDSAAEILKRLE